MAPWRILEQTIAMKTPDGEPGPTLQFTIDPANSAQCRLRIVSPEEGADAYEVVFNTGGLVVEQVYQPRILKPFHRGPIVVPPEPVEAPDPKNPDAKIMVNPLTNRPETDAERERREALQDLADKRAGLAEDRAREQHEEAEALAKVGKPFKMRTQAEIDAGLSPTQAAQPAKTLEQLQADDAAARSRVVDSASMKAQEKPVT